MEKPKPKTKSGKMPAVKPSPLAESLPGDPHAVGLPTIEELATIAATLAQSSTTPTPGKATEPLVALGWAEELVWAAMSLWITSRKRIIIAVETSEIRREDDDLENEMYPYAHDLFPNEECRSSESPVTRDIFLRQMLPKYKNRSADLARIAKAFVRDTLRGKSGKEPTHDEVSKAYGEWKNFGSWDQANTTAKHFQEWHRQYVTEVRRTAGLNSAAKRLSPSRSK